MELVKEVDENYDGVAPSGSSRDGYSTYCEPAASPLGNAIRAYLVLRAADRGKAPETYVWEQIRHQPLELTVHNCWSGYSEYTITSTWDEITVKWGSFEFEFDSMPEFFRALAVAEDAA